MTNVKSAGAGSPAPVDGIPPALYPVIRLGDGAPGVDLQARLTACYAAVAPSDATAATGGSATAPLLAVTKADGLTGHIPAAALKALVADEQQLVATLEKHLPAPMGTVKDQYTALTLAAQDRIPAGTPVFVRQTDQLVEQYALTRLVVDLKDGALSQVGGPEQRHPVQRPPVMIHAGSPVVSLLLSVSPFLPPPWGLGLTFGLSLLNLLTDTPPASDPLQSEFQALNAGIQQLLAASTKDPLDNVSRKVDQMMKAKALSTGKLQDLKPPFDASVQNLRVYLDGDHPDGTNTPEGNDPPTFFLGEAFQLLDQAQATIWNNLQGCDDANFDANLGLMIRCLALRMSVQKQSIQLRAVSAKFRQQQGLMDSFDLEVRTWLEQIDGVMTDYWDPKMVPDIGPGDALPAPGTLTSAQIMAILGDNTTPPGTTAWVPLLVAWLEKIRAARLALISGPIRVDPNAGGTYSHNGVNYPGDHTNYLGPWGSNTIGWTWRDPRFGKTYDNDKAHLWPDYYAHHCDQTKTQDFDNCLNERSTYATGIKNGVDGRTKQARDNLAAMGTLIKNLQDLLPPGAPTQVPKVAALTGGGPARVDQTWTAGNVVRYRVMLQNAKGPGPAGSWSDPHVIGTTKGAVVSGLQLEAPAESIQLQRQVRTSTQSWDLAGQALTLTTLAPDPTTKVMPTSYSDTLGPSTEVTGRETP
jgi:hypothetical protein